LAFLTKCQKGEIVDEEKTVKAKMYLGEPVKKKKEEKVEEKKEGEVKEKRVRKKKEEPKIQFLEEMEEETKDEFDPSKIKG